MCRSSVATCSGRRAWWWTDEALLQFSKHAVRCNADEPRAWVMRAEVLCAELGEERAHAAAARARADQRGDGGDARGAQALEVRERLKNTNTR